MKLIQSQLEEISYRTVRYGYVSLYCQVSCPCIARFRVLDLPGFVFLYCQVSSIPDKFYMPAKEKEYFLKYYFSVKSLLTISA
jgi:hypothetical protein